MTAAMMIASRLKVKFIPNYKTQILRE